MIFQEPMTSLSPLHTIGNQIGEALSIHTDVAQGRAARRAPRRCWAWSAFPNPTRAYDMYPFELSGGLRQRAMIAMALICRPALLIADEPTTALDVTIQAQILQLLRDLQTKLNMAMLLITHDLGVVANVADEVVVIYHGEIMEAGTVDDIFRRPQHPYLKGLMAAVPHFDMKPGERLKALREVPVDVEQPAGHARSRDAGAQAGDVLLSVARPRQVLHDAQVAAGSASGANAAVARRRRCQLRHQARRVPRPCRRKRLRQDHGQQDPDARRDARQRLGRRSTARDGPIDVLAAEGDELQRRCAPRIQMVFQDPVSLALAAHDGAEHPAPSRWRSTTAATPRTRPETVKRAAAGDRPRRPRI